MSSDVVLSLIIPFYNVGIHFKPLLDSLSRQLIEGVEVVLVCDGATDNSLALAQQHLAASPSPQRYQLLQQANAGVSAARNLGIQHARGSYIGFVDADDVLLDGYSEQLLSVIRQYQPDLIELGFKRFVELPMLSEAKPRYLHRHHGMRRCMQMAPAVFKANRWYPWMRVYRKAMAPDFCFPHGVAFCEDLMALPALYQQAKTLYHLRLPLYGYRVHGSNATSNVCSEQVETIRQFSLALERRQCYPNLPELWRSLFQAQLAYLLFQLWKDTGRDETMPAGMRRQLQSIARRYWFRPGLSLRKKLHLTFPDHFYRLDRRQHKLDCVSGMKN